jgi:hypothetical protein
VFVPVCASSIRQLNSNHQSKAKKIELVSTNQKQESKNRFKKKLNWLELVTTNQKQKAKTD